VIRPVRVLAVACAWLAAAAGLNAHQLDEYVQATLVSIEKGRVTLEVKLTPGVDIAPQVVAAIDRDADGRISEPEADAYAATVVGSLTLEVDGRARAVTLASRTFPAPAEMSEGLGTIRLKATAEFPAASGGSHQVFYRNLHRPELSVYLANALVPDDKAISIRGQQRDVQQRELRIDYEVSGDHRGRVASGAIATLIIIWAAARTRRMAELRSSKFEV
jgi:hypothetical protein